MELRLAALVLAPTLALASCADRPVVRVGVDPHNFPMEFRQDDNVLAGFDLDLMRAIGESEGFEVEFVAGSWPGLFLQGEVAGLLSTLGSSTDAVCSSGYITSERKVKYLVTEPYLDAGQLLAVPWDSAAQTLDDLTDSSVGVRLRSRGFDIVYRTFNARRDQMRLYETVDQALEDLLERRIGGVVAGRLELATAIAGNEAFKAGLRLTGPSLTDDELLGIYVHSGNDALLAKLNNGLTRVRESGRYGELLDRWALR